jgi:hypothetical protein
VEATFLTHMMALRRAAFQAVREPQGAGRRDLANVQFHHRVNFPRSVPGKMPSPVSDHVAAESPEKPEATRVDEVEPKWLIQGLDF